MPPERLAYALARYSRSPDSIQESLEWVRAHDSSKFLESFYFQYGHASIADLGHLAVCFEGISELAASEIEDEALWDGQARSSRYQDFSRAGYVTPPELDAAQAALYRAAGERLLAAYRAVHEKVLGYLHEKLPRPAEMKPGAYERNLAARAYDVARYLLFLGVPTGVGQVTSIRTLERQIRRWKGSEYAELREIGAETAAACAAPPGVPWKEGEDGEATAPTLAKYVDPDPYPARAKADLKLWAEQNLPAPSGLETRAVELVKASDTLADIVATLLYPVTTRPYRELYELACAWPRTRLHEVTGVALGKRARRDELLRAFRGGPYVFDMTIDIGAYRDLHRHRRCHQFRQDYTWEHGWETPAAVVEAGADEIYQAALREAAAVAAELPAPGREYLTAFGARSRFLFKMDFAEAEYIAKLRSGVKGHFSYREIAWQMKLRMEEVEPELGRLIEATPPWIEEPLTR
jgi:thymidylate synthase ThyX